MIYNVAIIFWYVLISYLWFPSLFCFVATSTYIYIQALNLKKEKYQWFCYVSSVNTRFFRYIFNVQRTSPLSLWEKKYFLRILCKHKKFNAICKKTCWTKKNSSVNFQLSFFWVSLKRRSKKFSREFRT